MADFNITYKKFIQPNEGYFANLTGDSGGETYGGIARNINPSWNGWSIVDAYVNAKGGLSKMKNNERIPQADSYVTDFFENLWSHNLMNEINSQDIANLLFDFIVNSGSSIAAKHIQKLLGLNPDGIIGNQTIGAINASNASQLYNSLKADREAFYRTIAANNPAYQNFLAGWLSRLSNFPPMTIGIGLGAFALIAIILTFLTLKK